MRAVDPADEAIRKSSQTRIEDGRLQPQGALTRHLRVSTAGIRRCQGRSEARYSLSVRENDPVNAPGLR